MSEEFKAAKFFLDKVKRLYPTFQYPDEIDIELWTEILEGHSQTDILDALKDYRRETEYNKAPNPAEFKKFLAAKSDSQGMRGRIFKCADELGDKYGKTAREKYLEIACQQWPDVDLSGHCWEEPGVLGCEKKTPKDMASDLMKQDIRFGSCRHLFPVYERAVRYIVEDLLAREIPVMEWRKMNFSERCAQTMKRGLFNDFGKVLLLVCRQMYGKDYQFESKNALKGAYLGDGVEKVQKYLGAHYRTDDDVMAAAAGL